MNAGRFYIMGQRLENESRDTEFKEGGGDGYVRWNLRDDVSKNLCGFLNSLQLGTLYIGVIDKGCEVVGIEWNEEKEDYIRQFIDEAVKTIKPTLFPDAYKVEFVSVLLNDGRDTYRKVVEIKLCTVTDNPIELYETGGKVFMRRDGSVQNLPISGIQDWHKRLKSQELKNALQRQERDHITQLENIEKECRNKLEEMMQENKTIQGQLTNTDIECNHKLEEMKQENENIQSQLTNTEIELNNIKTEIENLRTENTNFKREKEALLKKSKVCVIS